MRSSGTRSSLATLAATALGAMLAMTFAVPAAQAMPQRYADVGTIVWCDGGEEGFLEAYDTTQGGVAWSAGILIGEDVAVATGEDELLVGDRLEGTFAAHYEESGLVVGDLIIDGTISRGETEVVSGWDVDPDGRRYRSEGTRTPLSGSVTLSLGAAQTTLDCTGWEIDLETFLLERQPAAQNSKGWWQDGYELEGGAGTVGFYGDRRTELGIALDLAEPYAFGGERLQVRNRRVEGTMLLRDPETADVLGVATISGTLVETGRERSIEAGKTYRWVTTLVHYDVTLTITSPFGSWSGTWPATHETLRTRATIPPRALRSQPQDEGPDAAGLAPAPCLQSPGKAASRLMPGGACGAPGRR